MVDFEVCPLCGHRKPVSPNLERDAEIRRLYAEGQELEELAGKAGIGKERVRQIIGAENLRKIPKPSMRERNAVIYYARMNGWSARDIAEKWGLSRQYVSQIIRRLKRWPHLRGHE